MSKQEINKTTAKAKTSMDHIATALNAHIPIIWVQTHEEDRVITELVSACEKDFKMDSWAWSLWQGLVPSAQYNTGEQATGPMKGTHQPPAALDKIKAFQKTNNRNGTVVFMRDANVILQEPNLRQLKDMYQVLINNKTKLIIISATVSHGPGGQAQGLPMSLEKQITVINYELPSREEIEDRICSLVRTIIETTKIDSANPAHKRKQEIVTNLSALTEQDFYNASKACQGLTFLEIKNAIAGALFNSKTIDLKYLLECKKSILSRGDILEYFEANTNMNDVGGMDQLKAFFADYNESHSEESIKFGVEPLRGVLLNGTPGTGKSAIAKALASSWNLPLIKFDIGRVMSGIVGSSEQRMRTAIAQAKAVAPCLLFLDEVEKGISGTKSSSHTDGGTTARVFGTLLTAMQEDMKGITIIATSNDIDNLPPEFIRRFDEVFYVDLPGPSEREEIFTIHLNKKVKNIKDFDLPKLSTLTDTYTGHEIEKAVARAMALAYKDPEKKLKHSHIEKAIAETKPLSHIMGEKIDKMRREARGKYRYASSWAEQQALKIKTKKDKMDVKDLKLPEMTTKKTKTKSEQTIESEGLDLN
jgi:SpoVK/Ycf46/Vps4 family AAA+-type ATPase